MSVTYALELPFSLRVPELQFVVSRRGSGWEGWGSDEIAHLIDLQAKIPEGYEPHFRIALNQGSVLSPGPLNAARRAFPAWGGFANSEIGDDGVKEQRTAALVSVYSRALDSPFGGNDDQAAREWFSRQFDDALGLLNDYLVILAAMHDEWHISRISRADLPRHTPYEVDIRPIADGARTFSSKIDVHATLRDDLPNEREADELLAAVELIQAYREGRAPFWEWVQHYQAAEHHLGSGRYDQSVISATTAMEVLVNVFFRETWEALQLDPKRLAGVLGCGFRNQLTDQLPKFLCKTLDLDDVAHPPGRWYRDCYSLRNRTVHEGYRPSSAEAMDAKLTTRAFVAWIGTSMKDDPRTSQLKQVLQTGAGENAR